MSSQHSKVPLGAAAMVAAAFNFALFGYIARLLHDGFGVYHQLWTRILLMSLLGLCLPAGRATLARVRALPGKKLLYLVLQAFLIYPLGALTWVAAVQISPLATVAFITALPTEAVWGRIIFRDRLGVLGLVFLLLAVVGLWLVMAPSELGLGLGELLALVSSLGFSLGMMLSSRCPSGLSRTETSITLGLFGALMVGVLGMLYEPLPSHVDGTSVVALIASSALILVNFNLLAFGFQQLTGSLAGTILMLEVVFAASIGYFIFSELLPASTLYGGLLIVGSAIGLMLHERHPIPSRNVAVET